MNDDIPNVLRVRDIRKHYSVPRDPIYRAIDTGELPAVDVGTERKASYLIFKTDVEAWLRSLIKSKREHQ